MTRVVCVGELMVDVTARLPGPLAPGSDTPASVSFSGGGAGANVAAWLAQAGTPVSFVGRVGDDVAGHAAIEALRVAGVDAQVQIDPARPTGTCIVLVEADGERTMIPSNGANAALTATDIPSDTHTLYVSGYTLLDPASRAAGLHALEQARAASHSCAVDVASAAPLAALGVEQFLAMLGTDVLLFANTDEARVLTGQDDATLAARLLAKRCGQAVVKRGATGAIWSDGTELATTDGIACDVVDSTGAGDAFAAGFLAARLAGAAPATCLARGAQFGARAVQQVGARPN